MMAGGEEAQAKAKSIYDTVPVDQQEVARVLAINPSLTPAAAAAAINPILAPYSLGFTITETDIDIFRSQRYVNYFLNSRSSVAQLETVEIAHPAFSKTYRIVRNAAAGITATLETGGTAIFEYYPLKLVPQHARDDLDHSISVTFGDLGEVLPIELDRVMNYPQGLQIKPTVKYRIYRSDDLSAPLYGPLLLEVEAFTFNKEGSTFEAKAPSVNLTRTGEVYSLTRFPALKGFL